MGRPANCNCHCSCCLGAYGSFGSWFPQAWNIAVGSWSWNIPSGITERIDNGLTRETQVDSEQINSYTIAHPLTGFSGTNHKAWSWHADSYGAAFGTIPTQTPWGPTATTGSSPFYKWVAVDETSVAQWWHDAYGVVRNGLSYELSSVPAELHTELVPLIDTSDNVIAATPWMSYDLATMATLGSAYTGCFVSDLRIGASGYTVPWTLGEECNEDVTWQSGAATLGNSVEIGVVGEDTTSCRWEATVRIRPRFSVYSNGLLNRAEYYRTASPPSPLTLYANGYIRNGFVVSPQVERYLGRFGFVHPAIPWASGFYDAFFGSRGWTVPDYLLPTYATVGTGSVRFSDGSLNFGDTIPRLINGAGPGNVGTDVSNPPGGWRSWIEVKYRSVNTINCLSDLENGDPIAMAVVDDDVAVHYSGMPSGKIPWADWVSLMADAWGLSTPPATITIQRATEI